MELKYNFIRFIIQYLFTLQLREVSQAQVAASTIAGDAAALVRLPAVAYMLLQLLQ